jgi:peptidyl-prolyl cis-trans isomerase SurA
VKLNFFERAVLTLLAVLVSLSLFGSAALAQEGEPVIVDEVIAQINNDVLTLSMLKSEMQERVEALKQNGVPEQQARDEVAKKQAELIVTLINEQLLIQKGKDLNLTEEIEAEVNKRMLDVAKEQNIKTIEELEAKMVQSGYKPSEIRQMLRAEIMKQAVLQREVDARVFWDLSMDELKKYYEAHKDKFKRPESVSLSEIFLSLAGKNEAEVKARAAQLVADARSGKDFGALAAASSERQQNGQAVAPETRGKVGTFEVPNLRTDIGAAIKNLKPGQITDPIRTDEGYQILRLDERTPGSETPVFNENQVREAIAIERMPKAREDYLKNLRNDAYIKIAEGYRSMVEPLLGMSAKPAATATNSKTDEKKSDKKSKP